MMTIDLHNISMVGTTYDKTVKLGITLPGSLIKQTDKTCGDVPTHSDYIKNVLSDYIKIEEIHFTQIRRRILNVKPLVGNLNLDNDDDNRKIWIMKILVLKGQHEYCKKWLVNLNLFFIVNLR
jgi:hypothetical protein